MNTFTGDTLCPSCKKILHLKRVALGDTVECQHCHEILQVLNTASLLVVPASIEPQSPIFGEITKKINEILNLAEAYRRTGQLDELGRLRVNVQISLQHFEEMFSVLSDMGEKDE